MTDAIASAGAYLRRDFQIAVSYKVPFLFDLVGALFVLFEFFFVAKLVPEGATTGDYLRFVSIGLVVTTFLTSGASVIAGSVRQEQVQGTLEINLSMGLPPSVYALGIASYPLAAAVVRASIYAAIAGALGTRLPEANWLLAALALVLGAVSFVSIGLMAVALVLIFRQAAGAVGWLIGLTTLLAGVIFPIELLPGWLRVLSGLSPATWALQVTRDALQGAPWGNEWRALTVLALLGTASVAAAITALTLALQRARATGVLSQY